MQHPIAFNWRVRSTFLFIAVAICSSAAHAEVDYGNTILSVTTYTSTSSYPYASYETTSALKDQQPLVVDQKTGLQWIKASSVEEGQALGFRQATAAEFSALMTDKDWVASQTAPDEWSFSKGFTYTTSSTSSSPSGTNGTSHTVTNEAPITFRPDATMSESWQGAGTNAVSMSIGWLQGEAGMTVGAWISADKSYPGLCQTRGVCYTSETYQHEAVITDLQSLASGLRDASSHTTASKWSPLFASLPSSSIKYYMVSAVPESGTAAMFLLGFTALGAAVRARRAH